MSEAKFSTTNIEAFVSSLTFDRPLLSFIEDNKPYLQPVDNPLHHGLMSLALYEVHKESQGSLVGFWVQGISLEASDLGKVGRHTHNGIEEYIVIPDGSHYPGLTAAMLCLADHERKYTVYRIPSGEPHGSDELNQPAHGNWLSVKIKA